MTDASCREKASIGREPQHYFYDTKQLIKFVRWSMCQGHKKTVKIMKNLFMDLRLSLAKVSKVTEDLILNVGKRMTLYN